MTGINSPEGYAPEAELDLYEFPCSSAQQRFWMLDQMQASNSSCNVAVRWRLRGNLNPGWIAESFQWIAQYQDSLRTSFHVVNGELVQRIWPQVEIPIEVVNLSRKDTNEREVECERLTIEFGRKLFNLTQAPLLRLLLLQIAEQEHVLVVAAHHTIVDGWSMGLLARELGEAYAALEKGNRPHLKELPVQYADYSVWSQEQLSGERYSALRSYWESKLNGMKWLSLPVDYENGGNETNSHIVMRVLPRPLTDALHSLSKQHGVTLFSLALALFKMFLRQFCGQEDIALSTQCSGRSLIEVEDVVGCFINTLVLRTHVIGNLSFIDLMQRVHETVTEALAHDALPFDHVVQMLHPHRELGRNRFFAVNFIFQRAFVHNDQFAGIQLENLPARSPGALYNLNFFMVERVNGWYWSCEYDVGLYKEETPTHMLEQFELLAQAVVKNPQLTISELCLSVCNPPKAAVKGQLSFAVAETQAPSDAAPVSSVTDTERRMAELWKNFFNLSQIDVTANFFDLGGYSLRGVKLLALIRQEFGMQVPLERLFLSPTVRSLSAYLDGMHAKQYPEGILPIQEKGGHRPFFCINGWSEMRSLALGIGEDRPYLAVQIPPNEKLTVPYSVEEIAQLQIEQIRQLQPHGPYVLGGWCRAGVIAFEVAQQLKALGEEVELLVLFETTCPTFWRRMSLREQRRAHRSLEIWRWKVHFKKLLKEKASRRFFYVTDRLRNLKDRILRIVRHDLYRLFLAGSHKSLRYGKDQIMDLAVTTYYPKPYVGRIILFRADEYKTWEYWDPAYGWADIADQLTICEISGRHESAAFFKGSQAEHTGAQIRMELRQSS